jgi:hypothetical protein
LVGLRAEFRETGQEHIFAEVDWLNPHWIVANRSFSCSIGADIHSRDVPELWGEDRVRELRHLDDLSQEGE